MYRKHDKPSKRYVFYITEELRREIQQQAEREGMTFARFGRLALESYLQLKKQESRRAQLSETCKKFVNTRLLI